MSSNDKTTSYPRFDVATRQEIRLAARKRTEMFGFFKEVVVPYLPIDLAGEFLDEGVDDWPAKDLDRVAIVAEMVGYLEFAWGKALGHRGISAVRSVRRLAAWLFLLGDDEAARFADNHENYPKYGAPILLYVSRRYGATIPEEKAALRMAAGDLCVPGCQEGCGS